MSERRNTGVMWNVLGSIANAASSAMLLLFVTRICGTETAGIFSIAFVTAQMLMSVGNYGIRAYQITDIHEKYKFCEYEIHRIITCSMMMFSVFIFGVLRHYTADIFIVLILMGIYKMIDALGDVYEGRLQQTYHLEQAGKALFIRTMSGNVLFAITLLITRKIVVASIVAIASSIILLYLLAYRPTVTEPKVLLKKKTVMNHLISLFKECFPLFISLIILSYIVNIPKYSIENIMTYKEQTCYNIIYLPAQIIYLLATFIFKPFLTGMTDNYYNQMKVFKKNVCFVLVAICFITFLAVSIGFFCGIPFLQFVYGVELDRYKNALLIILLGGGFNALSSFLYYVLAIMRKQLLSMASYIIGLLLGILVADSFVTIYGIKGAALTYCISMMTITICMLISLIIKKSTDKGEK